MSLINVQHFDELKKLFEKNKSLCETNGLHVIAIDHVIDVLNKLSDNINILSKLTTSAKEERELNDVFIMATLMNQVISFSSANLVNYNKELTVFFHTLNEKMISNIDQQKVDIPTEVESSVVESEVIEQAKPKPKRGGKAKPKEEISEEPSENKPKSNGRKKKVEIVEPTTIVEEEKEVKVTKSNGRKKKTEIVELVTSTTTEEVKETKSTGRKKKVETTDPTTEEVKETKSTGRKKKTEK
jgi:hypothetical protein